MMPHPRRLSVAFRLANLVSSYTFYDWQARDVVAVGDRYLYDGDLRP
jgi:hypothetical protein